MAIEKPVIVSLSSQVHRAMKSWIDRNQLLIIASEYDVRFCKWFVGNGEYDSIKLFLASLNCYKDQITQILVRT